MNTTTMRRLGDYIRQVDERNSKGEVSLSQGICNQKYFQDPKQVSATPHLDKIVRTGQFAYNRATTRNGDKISIALREGPDCTVSSAYCVFVITDENVIDPHWLWRWFKRPEFDRYAIFKSHGSAHEFFEFETMCNVVLPVPSIEEQREIVARHKAIEHKIDVNRRLIAKLEETARTIYRHTFVENIDPENLPEGWEMVKLEELCESISAGVIPIYDESSPNIVLGQKCNCHGYIDLSKCLHHTPKANVKYLHFLDIVINSTGSGTLGRVTQLWFHPQQLAYDSNMTMIRPQSKYAVYIGEFVSTLKEYFENISQGSTSQTRLYCSMIRPLDVIKPPFDIVEDFSHKVSPLRNMQYLLRNEISKLEKDIDQII